MKFPLLSYLLLGVALAAKQSYTEIRVIPALSSKECETYCDTMHGCDEWDFDEHRGCVVTVALNVFVEGTSLQLLQVDASCETWLDDTCGLQYNTFMFGECSFEHDSPTQCMGFCSDGCEYIRDACFASCQSIVDIQLDFNPPANLLKLLEIPPGYLAQVQSELAELLHISEDQIVEMTAEENPDGSIIVRCKILPSADSLPTSVISETFVEDILILITAHPELIRLQDIKSTICHEGCRDPEGVPNEVEFRAQCFQPIDVGDDCTPHPPNDTVWGFNSQTGTCENFKYNGCNGNWNRFPGEPECIARCIPDALTYSCAWKLFKGFFQGQSFTAHHAGLQWIEPVCLPLDCVNDLDFNFLSGFARSTCEEDFGDCDALINCDHMTTPILLSRTDESPPMFIKRYEKSEKSLLTHNDCHSAICTTDECCTNYYCDSWDEDPAKCKWSGCFSSNSEVLTKDRGTVRLENVEIGDQVLSFDPNNNDIFYDEVYFLVHDHYMTGSEKQVDLLHLSYGNGAGSMELTATHLLYLAPLEPENSYGIPKDRTCVTVQGKKVCTHMAYEAQPGSTLYAMNNGVLEPFQIDNVTTVTTNIRGILTRSGNVIVDDVLSSCYINNHNEKHGTLGLLRWLYDIVPFLFKTPLRTFFSILEEVRKDFNLPPELFNVIFYSVFVFSAVKVARKCT